MRTTGEEGGQGWAIAGPSSQPKALVLEENKLSQASEGGSEQHESSSMSNLWVSASEGRPATGSGSNCESRCFHGQVADSAQELVETCDVVFSSGGSVLGEGHRLGASEPISEGGFSVLEISGLTSQCGKIGAMSAPKCGKIPSTHGCPISESDIFRLAIDLPYLYTFMQTGIGTLTNAVVHHVCFVIPKKHPEWNLLGCCGGNGGTSR